MASLSLLVQVRENKVSQSRCSNTAIVGGSAYTPRKQATKCALSYLFVRTLSTMAGPKPPLEVGTDRQVPGS